MYTFGYCIRAYYCMKKFFTERQGMHEPRVNEEGAAPRDLALRVEVGPQSAPWSACAVVWRIDSSSETAGPVRGVALWAQSRLARRTASKRPGAPVAVPAAAIQ
jgi:hypothetical protein